MIEKIQSNEASHQEIKDFLESWKNLDEESEKIMDSGAHHVLHITGNLRGIIRSAEDVIKESGGCSRDVLINGKLGLSSLSTYLNLLRKYSDFKNKESESMDGMFPEFSIHGRGSVDYTTFSLKRLKELHPEK